MTPDRFEQANYIIQNQLAKRRGTIDFSIRLDYAALRRGADNTVPSRSAVSTTLSIAGA